MAILDSIKSDGNSAQVQDNNGFAAFVFEALGLEGSQNTERDDTIFKAAE